MVRQENEAAEPNSPQVTNTSGTKELVQRNLFLRNEIDSSALILLPFVSTVRRQMKLAQIKPGLPADAHAERAAIVFEEIVVDADQQTSVFIGFGRAAALTTDVKNV